MKNFDLRNFLSENKLTSASKNRVITEEISISGIVSKFRDKVLNLPAFQKFIDTVVSKMTDEDVAKFKSKFNIAEAESVPSLDDIMKKAVSLNPDSDNTEPIKEEIDQESTIGKIINLVRILTGVNLLTSGAIVGLPLALLLAGPLTPLAGAVGVLISFIASCIVYAITVKLLGRGDNDSFLENAKSLKIEENEMSPKLDLSKVDMDSIDLDGFGSDYRDIDGVYIVSAQFLDGTELNDDELEELQDQIQDEIYDRAMEYSFSRAEDMYDDSKYDGS